MSTVFGKHSSWAKASLMLNDRVIATIGATGGIGSSIHVRVRAEGAFAIAIGRNPAKLAAIEADVARRITIDLTMPAMWDKALAALPELDGLVVCSGKLDIVPLQSGSAAAFTEVIDINLVAPALLIRHLLCARRIRDGASIVFIGSIAGHSGGCAAYGASKAGLTGLMRTLAAELVVRKIRVNCVSPGLVKTGMYAQVRTSMSAEEFAAYQKTYPLGICTPAGIAGPVAFLLSSESREITGQNLIVDGGATLG